MNLVRAKGLNGHYFIDIVKRPRDPETATGLQKLKFLTYSDWIRRLDFKCHDRGDGGWFGIVGVQGSFRKWSQLLSLYSSSKGRSKKIFMEGIESQSNY
jgi:hypothetical protein